MILSLLEKELLIEVLSNRVPNTKKEDIVSSVEKAESVVLNAAQAATNNSNLPTVNQNQERGWGVSVSGGGGVSIPGFTAGGQFGAGIEVHEKSFLDVIGDALEDVGKAAQPLIKPGCQLLAKTAYEAAVIAANALDPISRAAALVVAQAAYDKALKQC
ncbi:hypothetical protein P4283_29030 [Bacillus thuringiensis]|nr:hypothetical protein [Bacillus thuringiensis]